MSAALLSTSVQTFFCCFAYQVWIDFSANSANYLSFHIRRHRCKTTSPLTPLFGPMCCSAIPRKFCSGVFPPAQRHAAVMSWEHSYAISKLKKGFCSDVCFRYLADLVSSLSSPKLLNAHHFLCCVNVSSTNCINSSFCFMFCGVSTEMWQKI